MSNRNTYNKRILGDDLFNKVQKSRILLVGAGGIGCELLKNLVLSGFSQITVIDLDTIDVSNLNRQFLFQRQHVKQAKAHIAKESALQFNPTVNITSLQANIKDPAFDVQWFKQYTMVLNALDNLDARRHVNGMCLAADVPLVESGTQGYLGQAYVIQKDVTECFDCQPKPTPTTYAVCTIRSTPSAPIHCIVWAKSFLFNQLFGNSEEEDSIEEQADENKNELNALKVEAAELKEIKEAAGSSDYVEKLFNKIYKKDIERLISMDSMWKDRAPPVPLNYETLESELSQQAEDKEISDQEPWDTIENFRVFKDSVNRLSTRWLEEKEKDKDAVLVFDKDDDDTMEFVAAASNLRAFLFNIPTSSLFDIKSMAGNIIPAIATTNAIIAGVVIMKAFGVLRGDIKSITRTYLTYGSRLVQESNSEPNPQCGVCRSRSTTLLVDFEKVTLADILEKIVFVSREDGGAGMDREDVAITVGNRMIYDIEFDENVSDTLSEFGLKSGSILRVSENEEHVDLILESIDTDEQLKLLNPIPKPMNLQDNLKRKMEDDMEYENKRMKMSQDGDDSVIVLEEEDDVVMIDD
ncbi:hypothetical protein BDB01DRAFT_793174 [Pilobolus umbonatus]|nr:hypothetical protein BDB01DRAFT_793174 [Pilobolus umbonatus]